MVDISLSTVRRLEKVHPTPFFVFDYGIIEGNIGELRSLFPRFKHFYSVKANADENVLHFVQSKHLCFDVTSIEELQRVLDVSASARNIFFNHPIKTTQDIKNASRLGVQWFTVDSVHEIEKVFKLVKEPSFLIRLSISGRSALYPHTDKFGADPKTAQRLIEKFFFTIPPHRIGFSFQVGTQVTDAGDWICGLELCRQLINKTHVVPGVIDIGGGLPVDYEKSMKQARKKIAAAVQSFIEKSFPQTIQFTIEPGRFLVAEAGMLVVSVIAVVERLSASWIFVDAGAYSGLLEAPLSRVVYPVQSRGKKKKRIYNIAGPFRDGEDNIRKSILLPEVKHGHHLYIQNCGAYSLSFLTNYQLRPYPSVYFIHTT